MQHSGWTESRPHDRGRGAARQLLPFRLVLLVVALVVTSAVVACAQAAPTATAAPTPTRRAIALPRLPGRPTSTPTPAPYASGGLGLAKDEWEQRFGRPTRQATTLTEYRLGKFAVGFANDRAWYIQRFWGEGDFASFDAAREESLTLIPADASLVRSYQTRSLLAVDLYQSTSLIDRFKAGDAVENDSVDPWLGGFPGTFIVFYRERAGQVASIVVTTGNNP